MLLLMLLAWRVFDKEPLLVVCSVDAAGVRTSFVDCQTEMLTYRITRNRQLIETYLETC